MTSALGAMERLKEGFNKERADWEIEESSLIKRAENAEAALKPMVDELTGVKWQIHAMTAAVFGKHLFLILSIISSHVCRFTDASNDAGTRISHLGSDVRRS